MLLEYAAAEIWRRCRGRYGAECLAFRLHPPDVTIGCGARGCASLHMARGRRCTQAWTLAAAQRQWACDTPPHTSVQRTWA